MTALKLEILYGAPVAFLFTDLYVGLRAKIRDRQEELRNRPSVRRPQSTSR